MTAGPVDASYIVTVRSEGRFLGIRSVVGRSTDAYRGVSVAPATPRDPSPPTSLATVCAALETIEGAVVTQRRGLLVVSRADAELRIHVGADPVALPELAFEGDVVLALLALDALVPTFGAVQLHDEGFTEIIDGTVPIAVAVSRFRTAAHAELAQIQAAVRGVEDRSDEHNAPPLERRGRRAVRLGIAVAIALAGALGAVWVARDQLRGKAVGEACSSDRACESRECLRPRANASDGDRPAASGVCTIPCHEDAACPQGMTCAATERVFASHRPSSGRALQAGERCTPISWP